jgi:hypothetical protein
MGCSSRYDLFGAEKGDVDGSRSGRGLPAFCRNIGSLLLTTSISKVVEYRQHQPLTEDLAYHDRSQHFDAILDAVGTQALFENSPQYLKPTRTYVRIGTEEDKSQFESILRIDKTLYGRPFSGRGLEDLSLSAQP